MRLVLASASPRRTELLRAAGIEFDVLIANVDESLRAGESADTYVRRLAQAKARGVIDRAAGRPVLGADTVVVCGGEILGKPADAADAKRMLRMLSGRTHVVMTGVCLIHEPAKAGPHDSKVGPHDSDVEPAKAGPHESDAGLHDSDAGPHDSDVGAGFSPSTYASVGAGFSRPIIEVATTAVEFSRLSDEEIDWYVASGEPADKAGAYAIQGLGSRYVTAISGSYTNVVGLPVAAVYELCKTAGLLIS